LQGEATDAATIARIRQAIENEVPVTEILKNYRKNGTGFWNRLTIAPIYDEAGELTNYVGFQEDVSDWFEREQGLKETTQQLQAVIEASPDGMLVLDSDGVIQMWNGAAEQLLGYDAETVIGDSIRSLQIHANGGQAEFERYFERALDGNTVTTLEIFRQTTDDERIRLSLSTAPIRDDSAEITGVVGVITQLSSDANPFSTE
jgi:PAS domain S-box-containing protein